MDNTVKASEPPNAVITMKPLLIFICLVLMVGVASAITTDAVTDISNTKVTFNSHGGVAPCWYVWGAGSNYYWSTPNQSTCGSDYQYGSPMMTGQTYNVKACDATGCDATPVNFTVDPAKMIDITNFGYGVMTIWRSGFNITAVSAVIVEPYVMTIAGSELLPDALRQNAMGILIGILFFFIYVGYWLRGQGIGLPCFMSILSFVVIFGSGQVGVGVPPEFQKLGWALLVVGMTGLIYSWASNK